ncbi:MAG: hypothetical protein ACKVQS_01540 [Fimbriimonadaceae bacterium]
MRLITVCGLIWVGVGLTSLGFGDRLISTPMGKKLPHNAAKLEFLSQPSRDTVFGWFGYGLTDSIELEFYGESFDSSRITPGLNFSYNYISPITDLAPGISLGVLDITDQTREERAIYAAITFYFGNVGDLNQNEPTIFTLGGWSRHGGSFFFNAAFPFSEKIRLIGEHDGNRIGAGVELTPFEGASLKYLFLGGSPTVGFGFSKRF